MKTKRFLGINFWNSTTAELIQSADREGGLFTVPSAPSLAQMRKDETLMNAYQASDWAVVDGGYVALVLRLVFRRNLPRISGLQILQRLVGDKDRRSIPFQQRRVLWVVPTKAEKERIDYYLEDNGFSRKSQSWYYAPFYKKDTDFMDDELMAKIREEKPDWVIMCIGGGKQEKLAHYVRQQFTDGEYVSANGDVRDKGPVVLCTGGAIAFLTGGQANIPTWADRLYLGWMFRIMQSPTTFFPRYWNAGYELPRLLWDKRGSLFES
jgi:N-acetylglucosaminyldiphosphoundecaprenol N-acetyl-beta-D-mannosaminyltransferase